MDKNFGRPGPRFWIIGLTLCLAVPAQAQDLDVRRRPSDLRASSLTRPSRLSARKPTVGAPVAKVSGGKAVIPLLRVGNSLFVDVKINHRATARFLLDTGCSQTQISRRLARRLGFPEGRGETVTAQLAGGRQVQGRVVHLTEVRAGAARVSPVPAVVLDEEGASPYDGLLGMAFLNHFIFKIDVEKGKLVLQKRYKK